MEDSMTDRMVLLARAVVPWRAMVLAALIALTVGVVLVSNGPAGERPVGSSNAPARAALSSLPLPARAPVSATLGADSRAYGVIASSGGILRARNTSQRLQASFTRDGVRLQSGSLKLDLSLRQLGYGTALSAVDPVTPTAKANRVTYSHARLSEWYVNGPLGLEQGFTLPRAPSTRAPGPLTLELALSGGARASLAAGGASVTFSEAGARPLRYGNLVATDSRGRVMHSWLALRGEQLLLRVDARGARYPLRIDPLVQEGNKLTGGEESGTGLLGYSVALSADGNTALVGAPNDNNFAGAAWVFTRSDGVWAQQGPKLTGIEPGGSQGGEQCGEKTGEETEECGFGRSVALSGDGNTALIGSPRQAGSCASSEPCNNQGAAWVFTRSGSTWSTDATLTGGSEEGAEGRFGRSVALSADGATALVGAPADRGGPGAAWVFARSGSGVAWTHQGPKLTGGEESGAGHLGGSVALSADGNTALIGGPGDGGYAGAAWVFARSLTSAWAQQGAKLTGAGEQGEGHFGYSVALSADGGTALIGARADNGHAGAAWAFARSSSTWTQQGTKLTAGAEESPEGEFGYSVALTADGNGALIGAPHDGGAIGAAWLLTRSGETWNTPGEKLTALPEKPDGPASKGWFGASVALRSDGATGLIGAPTAGARTGAVWAFADPSVLPAVTGVSPETGPDAGGTTVRITGVRLAGATAVHFGAVPAAGFTVNPDGTITAVSPPKPAGTGPTGKTFVTVTSGEGTSSPVPGAEFRYVALPAVNEVSPSEGSVAGGTTVTISGKHIGEASAVKFGSVAAGSVTVNSPESITAVSPAHAPGTVDVTVTTLGGTSKGSPRDRFTFVVSTDEGASSTGAAAGAAGGVKGFISGCTASLLSKRIAVLSRARAAVKLIWKGAGTCAGRLRLSIKVKSGKRTKLKTIAAGSFVLTPGKARTVRIRLNSVGRSLLKAGHGRLRASLVIVNVSAGATRSRSANVRLALASTKKAKPPQTKTLKK
jgi:hypothetical protein